MGDERSGLLTTREAAARLGIEEGEVEEAISAGTLRRVYHRVKPEDPLESYVLGADVEALRGANPHAALNAAIRERVTRHRIVVSASEEPTLGRPQEVLRSGTGRAMNERPTNAEINERIRQALWNTPSGPIEI